MFLTIGGMKLHYERFEGDCVPTVLLHGWGADLSVMRGIYDSLKGNHKSVISLDLPFFGQSDPPQSCFGVYEYAETVRLFLKELGIEKCNLLGHSFGGRLSLILSEKYGIGEKIILTGAAGLKPKRGLRTRIRIFGYKLKKAFGMKPKNAGSADYKALPEGMKGVFVRIVNQHLDSLLPRITAPTLLIWGEYDRETPLYMAKKFNRGIADSGLVILKKAGHYSFLDCPREFYSVMHAFI